MSKLNALTRPQNEGKGTKETARNSMILMPRVLLVNVIQCRNMFEHDKNKDLDYHFSFSFRCVA